MLALVILNYKTYNDSYELIKSIYSSGLSDEVTIFLVDNETNENELSKLKCSLIEFGINIYILPQEHNLGFARGMNIGIDKAREKGFDFVVCSNNDVLIPTNFSFTDLIQPYQDNSRIACIGPQITNLHSISQNPLYWSDPFGGTAKKLLIKKIFLLPIIGCYIYVLRGLLKKMFMRDGVRKEVEEKDVIKQKKSGEVYSLHGSFFTLTPAYFAHYNNMDSNTFLYYEELILSKRIENVGLTCHLNANTVVVHKEDSSTNELLGSGTLRKSLFVLKENYRSLAYYLKNYI